jgi:hypothetical protein
MPGKIEENSSKIIERMKKMNKKRIIAYGLLLIVVIVLAFVGGIVYSQNTEVALPDIPVLFMGKSFSGFIVSADDKMLEIKTTDGNLQKFELNEATRIALPEKKLETGKYVKVIYKETKESMIAKVIKQVKKAPAEEPKASPAESPAVSPGEESPKPEVTGAPESPEAGKPEVTPEEGKTPEEVKPEGEEKAPEGEKKVEGEKIDEKAPDAKKEEPKKDEGM